MTRITATLQDPMTVAISNGRHSWTVDEPPEAGGADLGPTPYEMLIGSLAACTAITLRLYANHKGIAIEAVEATYEFDRVHADDCEECEDAAEGYIERIRAHVRITGTFDEAQQRRLAQIVSRCPVHKTLTNATAIFDSVEFATATE